MARVDLKSLIDKLNDTCRKALLDAASYCLSRTNHHVEIEHWLMRLLDSSDTDLISIFRRFEVDLSRLTADLTRALDRLKTGNARPPGFSPDTIDLARDAWLVASVNFRAPRIRSGHLLVALLGNDSLARLARNLAGIQQDFAA